MLKYAEINISDITVEHLDNKIEHIRWLSHSWTSIFLRADKTHIEIAHNIISTHTESDLEPDKNQI